MKRYNQHNITKGGEKMNSYVLKTRSIILVIVLLMFTVFTSECNKTTAPETPKPREIKWQQTSLDTEALAVFADKTSGLVFANNALGKLVRSLDQGKTWTISLEKIDVTDMVFRDNGDIFAFNNCYFSEFVLLSSNGGIEWSTFIAHDHASHCPKALVFHQSGYMFLGDFGALEIHEGDIYRSSDDGVTWQETSFPDSLGVRSMVINEKGDIFAGTTMGVYRSIDVGNSWTPVNEGIAKENGRPSAIYDLAINFDNNYIYSVSFRGEFYRSNDNANNWTMTEPGLNIFPSFVNNLEINSKGDIFVAVGKYSKPESVSGVFYSTDNGDNWKQANDGLSNTYVYNLAIDSFGFLYAATKEGVFRSVESTTK